MSPVALDLAARLLAYDPAKRASADEALEMPYFKEEPLPEHPTALEKLEGEWHELEAKREERDRQHARKRRKIAESTSSTGRETTSDVQMTNVND